jgi:hypothetical protein
MPQRKRMSLYITDAAAIDAFISFFSQSKWRLSHCGVKLSVGLQGSTLLRASHRLRFFSSLCVVKSPHLGFPK